MMNGETLPLFFAESPIDTTPNGFCGKTFRGFSQARITLSGASLANCAGLMLPSSQSVDGGRTRVWLLDRKELPRGVCSMLNLYEWTDTLMPCPSEDAVCSLSHVLEQAEIPQRYFLSPKACAGILLRAERRGKELPEQLERALRAVADLEPILNATVD